MAGTLRLFLDATYAIALMVCVGIPSGFATAAMTGDTQRSLQVPVAMYAVTGALLTVRLWRIVRADGLPPAEPAP